MATRFRPRSDPKQQAEQQEAKELARVAAVADAHKKTAEAKKAEAEAQQALVDLMFKEVSHGGSPAKAGIRARQGVDRSAD